jgi:hypothetical protein
MTNPQVLFLSIVISIAVFLLLREVFCWYFKINKRISLLSDIKDELVQANKYRNEGVETVHSELISKNITGGGSSEGGDGVASGKLGTGQGSWVPR